MPWPEVPLTAGWRLDGPGADGLRAPVPGTVAGAFRAAGLPLPDDLDAHAWTYNCSFPTPADGPVVLRLGGLATLAEVVLGGEVVLVSTSMWEEHALDVTARLAPPGEPNALELRFAPLAPEVARPRKPRARWRTRLVANGLRWHRTMLLGRAPGIAPPAPVAGPWRPVALEVRAGAGVGALALRPRLEGDDGVLGVLAELVGAPGAEVVLEGPSGVWRAPLDAAGRAELRVPGVARWWPHTHGAPVLHDVRLVADGVELAHRRVGFRALAAGPEGHEVLRDGLALRVNDVPVFARGAVWTPPDLVGLAPGVPVLRARLEAMRAAGMNLVRVVGTAAYEEPAFHDLCDELGLLVWQDAMLANLDYPLADPGFRAVLEAELAALLARLAGRPSTAVLCGGSEVAQQVAMLGLDPGALLADGVGEVLLPAAVAAAGCDAVVVPDAPSGGVRPFTSDAGVANWFGVGGYRRDLGETRRAAVRFASECLALANVPEAATLARAGQDGGVPRDAGADWDFADVRDHYLAGLHGEDPAALRTADPERYLALSRLVSGEVMAEVLGEWRRAASPCGGALVLWLADLVPGAGWGLLDDRGAPKAAWHHVRRALAPVAVWTTDEGLGGIAVHLANDGPEPLEAELHVALHGPGGRLVLEGREALVLPPHTTEARDAEAVLGRWVDVAHAYRFGPAAHDVLVATLTWGDGASAEAFRFPVGRPTTPRAAGELGARAELVRLPDGASAVRLTTTELLYGVRLVVPGSTPADDAFHLAPGRTRLVPLSATGVGAPGGDGRDPGVVRDVRGACVTAANLVGALPLGAPVGATLDGP